MSEPVAMGFVTRPQILVYIVDVMKGTPKGTHDSLHNIYYGYEYQQAIY